jgi:hypothetical protein
LQLFFKKKGDSPNFLGKFGKKLGTGKKLGEEIRDGEIRDGPQQIIQNK